MPYKAILASCLLLLRTAYAVPTAVPPNGVDEARWGPGGRWSDRPGSWNPRGGQYDLPLDWDPLGFASRIGVGSPRFDYKIFVDWTWVSNIVTTPKCYGQWNPSLCLHPQQPYWDPRNSTSFKNLTSEFADRSWRPNHFFMQDPMSIEYGSDLLHIGPVTGEAVLQLTDLQFNVSAKYGTPFPFTGIFGMSPVFRGDDGKMKPDISCQVDYQSAYYQQWKNGRWRTAHTGFVYCHEESRKPVCNGHDGIQTMGGIRRDLIKNQKIWWYDVRLYPDVNTIDFVYNPPVYNYWGIELAGLKIGTEVQKIEPTSNSSGKGAIFDHASYGRGTPLTPNAYARLAQITGGKSVELKEPPNNGDQKFFSVDCSKLKSFPSIKYKFTGSSREWAVTPEMYVEKMKDGSCVLNVRTLASGDKFIGNFGETFAKEKYIILDFEKNRVGIADMQW
ncbi:eukaryotic aspartyl protease, partial [Metarhizium majus ARSEF 297]